MISNERLAELQKEIETVRDNLVRLQAEEIQYFKEQEALADLEETLTAAKGVLTYHEVYNLVESVYGPSW